MAIPIISVFGSSQTAEGTAEYTMAQELGKQLARAGFGIATGGYGGSMEAVSRGAAEASGRVFGVVASAFSATAMSLCPAAPGPWWNSQWPGR
jgi:uncharacterized protein (TIGR00725 family)